MSAHPLRVALDRAHVPRRDRGGGAVAAGTRAAAIDRSEVLVMLNENTSASRPATADEIIGLLGEIEPPVLGALLATGATISEIAAAANVLADEYGFGEIRHAPVSARDAELRAILEDMLAEDVDEYQGA